MTYTSTDYESRLEGILIIRRGASIFWVFMFLSSLRSLFFEIFSSSVHWWSRFLKFLAPQFVDVLVFWNFMLFSSLVVLFSERFISSTGGRFCFLKFLFLPLVVSFFEIFISSAGGGSCFLKYLSLPLVDGLVFWNF